MFARWQHLVKPVKLTRSASANALTDNRARGGDTMSNKLPPFHHLLRDLPKELQDAIREAVAACKPCYCPRLYARDWQAELYHEAACAACEALARYDPAQGSLYRWGLRVIRQRLRKFCDGVWASARNEGSYPCDEETGEEVEFEDREACETIEENALCAEVREALARLSDLDRQLVAWYYGEGLRERAIAARLGCSQQVVSKRLKTILKRLCRWLGVAEPSFGQGKGRKSGRKRRKQG